jgi:hypothetical protein
MLRILFFILSLIFISSLSWAGKCPPVIEIHRNNVEGVILPLTCTEEGKSEVDPKTGTVSYTSGDHYSGGDFIPSEKEIDSAEKIISGKFDASLYTRRQYRGKLLENGDKELEIVLVKATEEGDGWKTDGVLIKLDGDCGRLIFYVNLKTQAIVNSYEGGCA